MTKRFAYIKNNSITQYQSLPIQEIGKSKALHCQGVVDKLNKLSDENEQLKQQVAFLEEFIKTGVQYEYYQKIYEDNEQLKQFKEKVASVIESKMGDNVCNDYKMEVLKEIWNELELDEVCFK